MDTLKLLAVAGLWIAQSACSPVESEPAVTTPELPVGSQPAIHVPTPELAAEDPSENQGSRASDEFESWRDFNSRQVPFDRQFLESLDERYFGVLSFSNADERAYLRRAGFPMPQEWLEARTMSDSALQAKADSGDPKAAGMYADRMIMRFKDLAALDKADPDGVPDADRVRAAALAATYAMQARNSSGKAFGAYVEGMVDSTIFNSWEPMTAAMLYGMRHGDPRVERLMSEMSTRHPQQNVSLLYSSLKGLSPERRD